MTPNAYMICGALLAPLSFAVDVAIGQDGLLFMMFAAGALFGKGYGVWEERDRRKSNP